MLIGAGPFYIRQFLGKFQPTLLLQPVHVALLRRGEFADPMLQVSNNLSHRAEPQFAIFHPRHSDASAIQTEEFAILGRYAQPAILSDPDKIRFVIHQKLWQRRT
jgi:hypothetical protein